MLELLNAVKQSLPFLDALASLETTQVSQWAAISPKSQCSQVSQSVSQSVSQVSQSAKSVSQPSQSVLPRNPGNLGNGPLEILEFL